MQGCVHHSTGSNNNNNTALFDALKELHIRSLSRKRGISRESVSNTVRLCYSADTNEQLGLQ